MKKILLSLTIAAFAVAAQASDAKAPACKDAKGGCCEKTCDKVKTSAEAKGGCCSEGTSAKADSKWKVSKALMSPKAMEIASK